VTPPAGLLPAGTPSPWARCFWGSFCEGGRWCLRITEVEAYCHTDTDLHTRALGGRSARPPYLGRGRHAYVCLCYGLHQMLNVTAGEEGTGAACLVRACEPVSWGSRLFSERRNMDVMKPAVLAGPGRARGCSGAQR